MPRKNRVHHFKAFYHVMLRGNNRQNIFFCDNDKLQFYYYLSQAHESYDCKIHLFCLMTNHLHLVIEVGHVPLAKIMQNVTSRYARYINKNQNRTGYLFEGRYNAVQVQNEKYLLELCYYIHMNPIKAGLANNLEQYKWSSHLAYNLQTRFDWLTTEFILNLLKKHVCGGKKHYQHFMADRDHCYKEPSFCKFDERGSLVICDEINNSYQSVKHYKPIALSLNKIAAIICEQMKITIEKLISDNLARHVVFARSIFTYFAHYRANYQLIDIANFLDRNRDSLSKTTHRAIKLIESTPKLKQLLHLLEVKLSEQDAS